MGSNITVNLLSNNPGNNGTHWRRESSWGALLECGRFLEEDRQTKRDMVVGWATVCYQFVGRLHPDRTDLSLLASFFRVVFEDIHPRIDCARNTVRYNSSADAVKRVIEFGSTPPPNQRSSSCLCPRSHRGRSFPIGCHMTTTACFRWVTITASQLEDNCSASISAAV
jgi:hypothetical protein